MERRIWITIITVSMTAVLTACGEKGPCKDGHTWVEATCTEPKTCSVCGATEGEALGHDWSENTPNYHQPKTCSRCNETEGDPLEAEFAKKGLAVETEWDKEFTITTPCYNDESKTTNGKYRFSNFRIAASDDALGLEAAQGYEWLIFDLICRYDDENVRKYGFTGVFNAGMDYYDTYNVGNSDLGTMFEPGKTDLETVDRFTLNWNVKDYPECIFLWGEYTDGWNAEGTVCISQHTIYIRIPTGYDGMVVSMIPNGSDVLDKLDAGEMVIDSLDDECVNFRVIPE